MIDKTVSLIRFGASSCQGGNFFGFPTWYKYLGKKDIVDPLSKQVTGCVPNVQGINDIWLIIAAVIDMLLRLAALAAVIFIIYGGILYITSDGQPDKAKKALTTIINSIVGLVIALGAAVFVSFVAGRFH